MAPADFYAHAVNELEQDIRQARDQRHFSAIASLRARQLAAFELMGTARAQADDTDALSTEELTEVIRDALWSMPEELREQVLAPVEPGRLELIARG